MKQTTKALSLILALIVIYLLAGTLFALKQDPANFIANMLVWPVNLVS